MGTLTLEQDLTRSIGMRLSYSGSHGSNLEAMVDLNQVQPNTVGYAVAATYLPYPDHQASSSRALPISRRATTRPVALWRFLRHSGKGITFDASWLPWTRWISPDTGGGA